MNKGKSKKKITLEFDSDDACAILGYKIFFEKHLELGSKIPARVLKKFISLFDIEEVKLKEKIKEQVEKVKQCAIDRYSNDKEYMFNKKLSIKVCFGANEKSVCSFEKMVDEVFNKIENGILERKEKKSIILLVYSSINEYFDNYKGNTLGLFSKYKRVVLSGYIAHKFGFYLSDSIRYIDEDELSNQMIYQSTKHYTKTKKAQK